MRKIVRHPMYQRQLEELNRKHPGILDTAKRLERLVSEEAGWPISLYLSAYDCWYSHLLDEDESIPHMRVFYSLDDDEVRFLTIVPVEDVE